MVLLAQRLFVDYPISLMFRSAHFATYHTQNTMSLILQVISLVGHYSVCVLNDVILTAAERW